MPTEHPSISFQKLYTEIGHNREISGYIDSSLSKLEVKLKGFSDANGIPPTVKESVCRDLSHVSACAGYLYEALECLCACLCRQHPEPDIVGTDTAIQIDHNDQRGGAA